ncbi:D-ribose pyranase [Halobacillus fulvus]|nr:D-ribose pyranase [Halobacillus fulvus]
MKKQGMLNRDIASTLARLGHTDTIVIADCGLPIPDGVPCIDVSLTKGFPGFFDVLEAIQDDMEIEAVTLAEEIKQHNPSLYEKLHFKETHIVSHEEFKSHTHKAKAVIRTGETTPYANIILHAGVIF